MQLLDFFPHFNALLNFLSSVCLVTGFILIQKGNRERHRQAMLSAAAISALFLISYLAHHSIRTYYFGLGPTRFAGEGIWRPVYFTILTSHTILAAAVAPFVLITLRRALRADFEKHKKIAKLVFPVWLYVSITGVIVYLMLYIIFPRQL
ncbi:MAG TPA: DUF420 domain-containing protein [Pyrinomonadaceae bacterium]|nr:DUF420 domain-containing protein [Pyrinomonadaceae bacterium]